MRTEEDQIKNNTLSGQEKGCQRGKFRYPFLYLKPKRRKSVSSDRKRFLFLPWEAGGGEFSFSVYAAENLMDNIDLVIQLSFSVSLDDAIEVTVTETRIMH